MVAIGATTDKWGIQPGAFDISVKVQKGEYIVCAPRRKPTNSCSRPNPPATGRRRKAYPLQCDRRHERRGLHVL